MWGGVWYNGGVNNTNKNLYNVFLLVYEMRNMHRVADKLRVSRSAISQNIKELSSQLGVPLFTSSRQGVVPTGEANNLYPIVKSAMESIAQAETGLQAFTADSIGIIKMAMSNTTVELYVKDYLKEFCKKYPKVRLHFFNRDSIGLLEQGKIDFILDLDFIFKSTDFKTIDLFDMSGAFFASKEFLKENNLTANITKAQLFGLPIITQPSSWAEFFKSVEPFMIASSANMVISMVKSSIGVGFHCRELLDKLNDDELVILNVKDLTMPTGKVVCGYSTSLSRPAQAFIDGLVAKCFKFEY